MNAYVDPDLCIGCTICKRTCQFEAISGALKQVHEVNEACTGCGECNRACPMGIPVGALKLQMGRVVKKLFEYAPGMDVDAVPPLLGFQLEEKNIHEHHIEGA